MPPPHRSHPPPDPTPSDPSLQRPSFYLRPLLRWGPKADPIPIPSFPPSFPPPIFDGGGVRGGCDGSGRRERDGHSLIPPWMAVPIPPPNSLIPPFLRARPAKLAIPIHSPPTPVYPPPKGGCHLSLPPPHRTPSIPPPSLMGLGNDGGCDGLATPRSLGPPIAALQSDPIPSHQ